MRLSQLKPGQKFRAVSLYGGIPTLCMKVRPAYYLNPRYTSNWYIQLEDLDDNNFAFDVREASEDIEVELVRSKEDIK